MRFFTSLITLFIFSQITAQIKFVPGYLINDKGDTLKGELKINPKKELDNYNKAFFKDAQGQQKNYKPNKVKGYGFDGKHFVAMELDGEPKFYQRLANGSIMLYKVAFEVSSASENSYDFDYFLFREGDKKLTDVKIGKFKKQLQEWMSGAAEFASDYQEDKKFNEESAINCIKNYNNWKSSH